MNYLTLSDTGTGNETVKIDINGDLTCITGDLIVSGTNKTLNLPNHNDVDSTLTTIENDVTDLETATSGITYDNTGSADLTTITNNVLIGTNKYIRTPQMQFFSETYRIRTENPSQLALYAANTSNGSIGFYTGSDSGVGNETIKIDVNGNLTCRKGDLIVSGTNKTLNLPSHSDVDSTLTTIENDVTNLETATTGITYDNTGSADSTTINNNVLIGNSKYIRAPQIQVVGDQQIITTQPSQLALFSKNATGQGIGFYMGTSTGSNGGESVHMKVNGDVQCRLGDLIVSGSGKTLNLPDHSDVDQALTDLENDVTNLKTATTGITYANFSDTTIIDNNVIINNKLDLPDHDDVDQALTDIEEKLTGITYASGSDTTSINNNLSLERSTFSIKAPLLPVGTEDIPVSIETPLQVSTSDTSTAEKGTIHLAMPSGGTQGDGNLATGISFSRINSNRRGALIASFQDGSDRDRCGLKFFTKNTTTTGTDEVETEAMTISSSGNITAPGNIDTPEVRSQVLRAKTSSDMEFQNENGRKNMVLTTQGKLGIKTDAATPTHDLTVVGDAAITDDLTVTGKVTANGGITIGDTKFPTVASTQQHITSGLNADRTETGIQSFGVTYTTPPVVTCQIMQNVIGNYVVVNIYNVTTTKFSYRKFRTGTGGVTVVSSSGEFYWTAIGDASL